MYGRSNTQKDEYKPATGPTLQALYTWASGRDVNGRDQIFPSIDRYNHVRKITESGDPYSGVGYHLTEQYNIYFDVFTNRILITGVPVPVATKSDILCYLSLVLGLSLISLEAIKRYLPKKPLYPPTITDFDTWKSVDQIKEYVDDPIVFFCLWKMLLMTSPESYRFLDRLKRRFTLGKITNEQQYIQGMLACRVYNFNSSVDALWPLFHIWEKKIIHYMEERGPGEITYHLKDGGSTLEVGTESASQDWGYTGRWTWHAVRYLFKRENSECSDSDSDSES